MLLCPEGKVVTKIEEMKEIIGSIHEAPQSKVAECSTDRLIYVFIEFRVTYLSVTATATPAFTDLIAEASTSKAGANLVPTRVYSIYRTV